MTKAGWTLVMSLVVGCGATRLPSPTTLPDDPYVHQAEEERLSVEMRTHAGRSMWPGTVRAWASMQGLMGERAISDIKLAVTAYRQTGGVGEARALLLDTSPRGLDADMRAWLADVERNYGAVALSRDIRAARLAVPQMPFLPERVRAIHRAQDALKADGRFDGYLPVGDYRFGDQSFTVQAAAPRLHVVATARR